MNQLQDSMRNTWLNDFQSESKLDNLLKLQNKLKAEGLHHFERMKSGIRLSPTEMASFRSLGHLFATRSAFTDKFVAEKIERAREKLSSNRQLIYLVTAAMLVLCFALTLAFTLALRKSFNDYVAYKEDSEKRVRESEERFRKIFENEPQCVKLYDRNGLLLDMNPAGLKIIESESIEFARGQSVYDLIAPQDKEFFVQSAQEVFQKGSFQHIEFNIIGVKGAERSMESYQVPIRNENDEVTSILAITYDVTQKKKAEKEKRENQEAMIYAGRVNMMGELASNMAHELNQPLTSTVNFAYILAAEVENIDSPNAKKLASQILAESMRASKIVAGLRRLVYKQPTQSELEDINTIVKNVSRLLADNIRSQNIDYQEMLANDLPEIRCDKVQIQQVLYNLKKNSVDAFASTRTDKPRMLTVSTGLTANDKYLEIQIEDTATGIDEEKLDSIFEPFVTSKENGLGMGLAISKSITEAHGGLLEVESSIDKGTKFRLLLPLERVDLDMDNVQAKSDVLC